MVKEAPVQARSQLRNQKFPPNERRNRVTHAYEKHVVASVSLGRVY